MKFKFAANLSNGMAQFLANRNVYHSNRCPKCVTCLPNCSVLTLIFAWFVAIYSLIAIYCSQNLLVPTEHYLQMKLSAVNSTKNIARIRWMLIKWLVRKYFARVHVRDFNSNNTSIGRWFYGFTISCFCLGFNFFFDYRRFSHSKGVRVQRASMHNMRILSEKTSHGKNEFLEFLVVWIIRNISSVCRFISCHQVCPDTIL